MRIWRGSSALLHFALYVLLNSPRATALLAFAAFFWRARTRCGAHLRRMRHAIPPPAITHLPYTTSLYPHATTPARTTTRRKYLLPLLILVVRWMTGLPLVAPLSHLLSLPSIYISPAYFVVTQCVRERCAAIFSDLRAIAL